MGHKLKYAEIKTSRIGTILATRKTIAWCTFRFVFLMLQHAFVDQSMDVTMILVRLISSVSMIKEYAMRLQQMHLFLVGMRFSNVVKKLKEQPTQH